MSSLKYKGYVGSVEFDLEDNILYGKLLHIRDLITFESEDVQGLQSAFEAAVDDYIEDCKRDGVNPDKPFKGMFNVRVRPDLHRELVVSAQRNGCSLNEYVNSVLVEHAGVGRGAQPRSLETTSWVTIAGSRVPVLEQVWDAGFNQGSVEKSESREVVFRPKVVSLRQYQ